MITKIFRLLHKILGIPLSIVFVLWFVSGIVMVFHSKFPRTPSIMPTAGYVSGTILSADSLITLSGVNPEQLKSFLITAKQGDSVAEIVTADTTISIKATSGEPFVPKKFSISETASQWCVAPVAKIDTLTAVDQWIPFERYEEQLPIYKYHFADDDSHQLYITREGDVIQFTTKGERLKAWFSTIPHWIYFTGLRKHQQAWISTVKCLALLGCLMCLAGIIVAVLLWCKQGKRHGYYHILYKKPLWRWHFILGLLFGWSAITFAFSGYMSLAPLPGFLTKERSGDAGSNSGKRDGRPPRHGMMGRGSGKVADISTYMLDIRRVAQSSDSILFISMKEWESHPYYSVAYPNSSRNIDASRMDSIADLLLTTEMVRQSVAQKHPRENVEIEQIDAYDSDYFFNNKNTTALPAIRVKYPGDELNKVEYYNSRTFNIRAVDDNSRRHNLLYGGLHSLNIKFLIDHPWLWWTVMSILMTGGTALSITGLLLAINWLMRQFTPKKKH